MDELAPYRYLIAAELNKYVSAIMDTGGLVNGLVASVRATGAHGQKLAVLVGNVVNNLAALADDNLTYVSLLLDSTMTPAAYIGHCKDATPIDRVYGRNLIFDKLSKAAVSLVGPKNVGDAGAHRLSVLASTASTTSTGLEGREDPAGRPDHISSIAARIERGCFEWAVENSHGASTNSAFESKAFADLYGTRCGTVAGLLSPDSSVGARFRVDAVGDLLRGAVRPEAIGRMTEKELCPRAIEEDRRIIAERQNQKIVTKTSKLFRCPFCGLKECTYVSVRPLSGDEATQYRCTCVCGKMWTSR